jgi:uncharacterized protein YndB with AHSA1/START domain
VAADLVREDQTLEEQMGRVLVSTVVDAPVGAVWRVLREFDSMGRWMPRPGRDIEMEAGKASDQVSAVRDMKADGVTRGRERLLALSDVDRTFTYEIAAPVEGFDIEDYRATVTVRPVTDSNRTFIEFRATFDSDLSRKAHWENHFATNTFGGQIAALASYFEANPQ